MNDPVAWSIAAVAVIAALSTAIVNITLALRNGVKLDAAAEKADAAATAATDVAEKTEEIHVLVNSNMSAAQEEIKALKETVITLQETVAKLATAGRTADSEIIQTAIAETEALPAPPPEPPPSTTDPLKA